MIMYQIYEQLLFIYYKYLVFYRPFRFAHLAAASFLSRGFKVYLCHKCVHTPLIPFSVLKLKCLAGVMVTASHNPKDYNGYKVYAENGVQIIPPVDAHVARMIQENQVRILHGFCFLLN